MAWTDDRIDLLKKLWEKGLTASQIAEELGEVSRNAVIGKAHRLGLKSRPSPVKSNEAEKKAEPEPAPKAAEPAPAPTPEAKEEAPATTDSAPEEQEQKADSKPQQKVVSIGPGGFMRQGPGDQQPPVQEPRSGQAPNHCRSTAPGDPGRDLPSIHQGTAPSNPPTCS